MVVTHTRVFSERTHAQHENDASVLVGVLSPSFAQSSDLFIAEHESIPIEQKRAIRTEHNLCLFKNLYRSRSLRSCKELFFKQINTSGVVP